MKQRISIRSASGFTLIEIMVVVVILGILGALVVPNIIGKAGEARVSAAKSDIKSIEGALDMYKLDNFRYPSTDQGLEALVSKPSADPEPKKWQQYLKQLPTDPWGEPYVYINNDGQVEIITYGADGQEGGEGEDTDISNMNAKDSDS